MRCTRSALIAVVAFVILDAAFIRNDFSYNIVAGGSSLDDAVLLPRRRDLGHPAGVAAAVGDAVQCWASLALFLTRSKMREVVPWAQATLFVLVGFFLALNTFFANPFETTSGPDTPTQGAGLDPLLRHTTMMIHPPMLYSGYTLMLIPFASRSARSSPAGVNSEWISVTRRFALGAWLFLGHRDHAGRALVLHRARAGVASGAGTRWRTRR